jgi:MFS family permease
MQRARDGRERFPFGIVGTAPLRSPAFRRWLAAATLVNICLWTYLTGLTWTMLARTDSAATVSLIQTLMTLPLPLVMLPAGLLTDRFGSRPMMTAAYIGYASCVGLSGVLVLGTAVPVPAVLALAFALGCFDALNVVATPVFVGRSVPPEQMGAAIGLSTLSAGFGRIAGGPLGGLIVGAVGPSAALLPAAGVLLLALVVVRTLPRVAAGQSAVRWRYGDLTAAFGWARTSALTRLLLVLGATMALLVSGYVALLPVAIRQLVGGGAPQLGLGIAAGGVGVIVASFFIDPIGRRLGRVRTALLGLTSAAVLLGALSWSHAFGLTALLIGLLSAAVATFSATTNLLLQSSAPGALRGRVLALYGLVFYTLQPIGIVTAGILADRLNVGQVLLGMSGATLVALAAVVVLNRPVWPAIRGRDMLSARGLEPVEPAIAPAVNPEIGSEPAGGS